MRGIISWLRRLALRALGIDLVIENCKPLPELFVEMRESQGLAADSAAVASELDNISRRLEELSRRAACAVKVEAAFLDATASRRLVVAISRDLLAHLYGTLKRGRASTFDAHRRARMDITRGRIDATTSALSPEPPPTEARAVVGEAPEGEPCAAGCDVVEPADECATTEPGDE